MASKTAFPCTLSINIPFPSAKYAAIALRALSVDKELSPLVRRRFDIGSPEATDESMSMGKDTILRVEYSATTPRMLRVATNGFFESLGVVLATMEELDVDVLEMPGKDSVAGAQGIEPLEDDG